MGRTAYRSLHIYLRRLRTPESRPTISFGNPSEEAMTMIRHRWPENEYDYVWEKRRLPDAIRTTEDPVDRIKWTSRRLVP